MNAPRRTESRRFFVIVVAVIAALGAAIAAVVARQILRPRAGIAGSTVAAVTGAGVSDPVVRPALPALGPPGQVRLSLALPDEIPLGAVSYVVQSAANTVITRGTIVIDGATTKSVSRVLDLPSGKGNVVTFVGSATVEGIDRSVYLGRANFDVDPTRATSVEVQAAARGGATASGAPTAFPRVPGSAVTVDDLTACRSCQLSSNKPLCDAPNLTATASVNAETGEETGIGWGCETLPSGEGKAACEALLRCFNLNDCARPGASPLVGCYCGQANPDACFAGQGLTGACVSEFQAAARASAGGPSPSATVADLSRFVVVASPNPRTPVGLAANLKVCAIETPCDVCANL